MRRDASLSSQLTLKAKSSFSPRFSRTRPHVLREYIPSALLLDSQRDFLVADTKEYLAAQRVAEQPAVVGSDGVVAVNGRQVRRWLKRVFTGLLTISFNLNQKYHGYFSCSCCE